MFDYLIVLISVISFWVALAMVGVLLLYRIAVILRDGFDLRKSLFVILMPFSMGYFFTYKEKSRTRTWYQVLVMIQFFLIMIGFILIFYTRYM